MWWWWVVVDQPITDPISGSSFDFTSHVWPWAWQYAARQRRRGAWWRAWPWWSLCCTTMCSALTEKPTGSPQASTKINSNTCNQSSPWVKKFTYISGKDVSPEKVIVTEVTSIDRPQSRMESPPGLSWVRPTKSQGSRPRWRNRVVPYKINIKAYILAIINFNLMLSLWLFNVSAPTLIYFF